MDGNHQHIDQRSAAYNNYENVDATWCNDSHIAKLNSMGASSGDLGSRVDSCIKQFLTLHLDDYSSHAAGEIQIQEVSE